MPQEIKYHCVAPVTASGDDLTADLDEAKVSVHITDAVDRISGGLHPASLYAVWEFDARPNPAEAAEAARGERPARILIHAGGGRLLELADRYRLELLVSTESVTA